MKIFCRSGCWTFWSSPTGTSVVSTLTVLTWGSPWTMTLIWSPPRYVNTVFWLVNNIVLIWLPPRVTLTSPSLTMFLLADERWWSASQGSQGDWAFLSRWEIVTLILSAKPKYISILGWCGKQNANIDLKNLSWHGSWPDRKTACRRRHS